MIEQLPYELTAGVTATREGLFFDGNYYHLVDFMGASLDIHDVFVEVYSYSNYRGLTHDYWLTWPDAADRLRYRKGEPWCARYTPSSGTYNGTSIMGPEDGPILRRLAAILCDDSNAFCVLHWCVHNLT